MKMDFKKLSLTIIALCPLAAAAQAPATDPAVAEYEGLLRDIRSLEQYNILRQRQIDRQQQDITNIQNAIAQVPELEVALPPLLQNMIDGLAEFVDNDLPFLVEEREDRIAQRYLMLEETNVSNAQKLRRILEAWMIEVEYGSAFHTETGEVMIDGALRPADFVVMGRIGIVFQTSDDDRITGAWDAANNNWVTLGSEHRNSVGQAIRMARNQIAPDLLLLPVVAAE